MTSLLEEFRKIEPDKPEPDGDPVEYPVTIKMESAILGAAVDVFLWPDRATVDGVGYSNQELVDLKSSGLPADDLRVVNRIKKQFDGAVIPERGG